MDIFTFIFLVVLVGCSIPLLKIWLEGRQHRALPARLLYSGAFRTVTPRR